jgi:D-serine deaminase-like pyridoxal phosphate-dependent protein
MEQIDTPALLVDLDAMESNLRSMASFFAARACKLRPHFKNHKSPILAWKQIRAGAIGMTCATVREAESLVEHGVDDILIANEIAGEEKPRRVAELSRQAALMVAVDSSSAVRDLAVAQRNSNATIRVLVDINIGLNRCGVQTGLTALELAKYAAAQGLTVCGVMGYDGHLQAMPASAERDAMVRQGSAALVEAATLLKNSGIAAPVVSTGGTGTFSVSGDYPGITEIQAGSYLLMDSAYLGRDAPFQRSLTVLTTVISTRGTEYAVLDCGVKAMSGERGLPTLKDVPGARITALHAEHALVELGPQVSPELKPGDKLQLWVHYSDGTVNLHTTMYGVRHGRVEEVFRIEH